MNDAQSAAFRVLRVTRDQEASSEVYQDERPEVWRDAYEQDVIAVAEAVLTQRKGTHDTIRRLERLIEGTTE